MVMNTIKYNMARAALIFCLGLIVSVTKAQDDRGERLQESISSSDQRTDFSARKAAPSKIDSFAFKELLKARKGCKEAEQKLAKLQANYDKKSLNGTLSSTDASSLNKAHAEWNKARAALKAAERKANAD